MRILIFWLCSDFETYYSMLFGSGVSEKEVLLRLVYDDFKTTANISYHIMEDQTGKDVEMLMEFFDEE